MGHLNTSGWINIDFHLSFMPIKLELRVKAFLRGAGSVTEKVGKNQTHMGKQP